jgi:hypothetical protein
MSLAFIEQDVNPRVKVRQQGISILQRNGHQGTQRLDGVGALHRRRWLCACWLDSANTSLLSELTAYSAAVSTTTFP